jgi:hypothetical protein
MSKTRRGVIAAFGVSIFAAVAASGCATTGGPDRASVASPSVASLPTTSEKPGWEAVKHSARQRRMTPEQHRRIVKDYKRTLSDI